MSASLLSRLKNIRKMKKLPEISENQVSSVPAWDIWRFQEVFVRSGVFCTKQRKMKFVFCFFPWGYRIFVLLFRLNFYKNLDFWDGVTGHVMPMSIIKDREHCHG